MRKMHSLMIVGALASTACPSNAGSDSQGEDSATTDPTGTPTSQDPGETGEQSSGDGDGDTAGDGDGDTAGDGDGDTAGDGDGDTSGDGDGDTAGDGDGDDATDSDSGTKFDLGDPDLGEGTTGIDDDSDIEVVITGDNAYGFGYGSEDGINTYYGGIENTTAGQIFNCNGGPEEYLIPNAEAQFASYLYIVGYADSSVTQGVLGRFRRLGGVGGFGDNIFTGDPGWEVCATGMNYSPGSGGPDEATIDLMIQACNDESLDPLTTSVGWVDSEGTEFGALAVGEDNTTPYNGGPMLGNEFPITCQAKMDLDARWMWFNWDPANVQWPQQSPFLWPGGGSNPDHQFLLFRLAADSIPPPT